MKTIYTEKEKKKSLKIYKGQPNWDQSLGKTAEGLTVPNYSVYVPKSQEYILILKKYDFVIEYTNVELLRAFLTTYGQILPRIETRLTIQQQARIGKAIRRARAEGLIPFTYL